MENYRKHIGYLRRTGPRKARAGRKSGRPPVPTYYWHATRRPMQYTPHQKRRSDARCDIIISRGLRRTSPCSARHPHKGDRALGVILSPEDCNLQACAAHAKQKKGDRTHVRSPFVLRTLRPYQHGALDLQTNARTWHGCCKTHRTRAEIPTKGPLGQEDMLG